MQPQPMIAVRDVTTSSLWYQKLLNCQSAHGGSEYERLVRDGVLLLQLHHADQDAHPFLGKPGEERSGSGVLLWFATDDFDAAVGRARELNAKILEEPHVNPNANHRELWIRDPDGYVLVLSGPFGDVG